MSNPTLASITAELEAVETAARGRGSLTCDHLAGRIANIRGELQQIAQPQPPAEAQPADQTFAEWLVSEMPAGTVIGDPAWWAGRIARQYAKRTSPPSAPVGVEAMPGLRRELSGIVRRGDAGMVSIEPNEAAAILVALAQQPAAVDTSWLLPILDAAAQGESVSMAAGDAARRIRAGQQPAAVDGEAAEALRFLLTRIGSWTNARWDQHLRYEFGDERAERMIAALDAQQGGAE